jgi:hypothetical protein
MTALLTVLFLILILIGGPKVWAACVIGGAALIALCTVVKAITGVGQ